MNKGFTLIELLVVVLIIGILAAVALPQYQKAVEKSKAAQGIALVKSLGAAASAYYLANGTLVNSLEQLDIGLTEAQKEQFWCNTNISVACDKTEWAVALYDASNGVAGVTAWRTTGPYKGGGFAMYYTAGTSNVEVNKLYCIERTVGVNKISKENIYCKQLMNGSFVGDPTNCAHYILL